MNYKIILVVVLITLALVVAFGDFGSDTNSTAKESSDASEIAIIKPLELHKQSGDVAEINKNSNTLVELNHPKQVRQERINMDDSRFTKEGQAYTTLGELMMKNTKQVDPTSYSTTLSKQILQAKYNLKIAKQMAYLSKDLFVETEDGKKIDEEVYEKIKDLRNDLIVELKRDLPQ